MIPGICFFRVSFEAIVDELERLTDRSVKQKIFNARFSFTILNEKSKAAPT